MYIANASPNARVPNVTYIPPAHVWLAFGQWGLALGQGGFALGRLGVALGPQGFLDTNMLVSARHNTRVEGQAQHEPPT